MNTEILRRSFFTAFGAIGTALAPTAPYVLLCTAAVLFDCLSAWLLSRRVKKYYPDLVDKDAGKFKSYHFGKTIFTLLCVYMLLVFAYYLEMYVTDELPFNALKLAAGAVIFWQGWSILENSSSCNGAKWAVILQRIMVDKTERHFDIALPELKHHGSEDGEGNAGNRSAILQGLMSTAVPDDALRLTLERTALKKLYTIGHLYAMVNGKKTYVCDTIEDTVRDINKNGVFDNGEKKIAKLTAIPYGTFRIGWSRSERFGTVKFMEAAKYDHTMPWVLNVPSFQGILIHCGVSEKSSAGCIIVGYNKVVGRVVDSRKAFNLLMDKYLWPARKRGQKIYITIV